ncbi:membrane protein [Pseudoclavibacter endophyticus]|uniref:Neutral zinc metallopeptidase n=1 Tax=Pseudoclavibacter endophyticus TaxID=1778590 RepID=A0A6H9WIB5_9MICO|nr:neutral zinc metallopeptidase [Pseudoclavibacter endophyticus]KAB1648237.1 neutral zinc metallopeptidase [Pseudoclavibacter endophyticus]GGA70899.1 membrane protein [Pseudoclavibacter endophyticus]
MTFNEQSKLDTSGVRRRGGRAGTGVAIGGGGLVVLVIALLASQFLGVDLTGLVGGTDTEQSQGQEGDVDLDHCQTGADANAYVECRMVGAQNSLESYWSGQGPSMGIDYRTPGFVLYSGQTTSGCGTASNAVGPFYCPGDESMYIDTSFFEILEQSYGSSGGPLAEMYVVAHEYGHHIQHLTGVLGQANTQDRGPASDGVRVELQADCYAGDWVGEAANTTDAEGNQLLQPPTRDEIAQALGAAASVGDDHIQESSGQEVNPEAFSHGSSEQRQRWFITGYEQGWEACDTFSASASEL